MSREGALPEQGALLGQGMLPEQGFVASIVALRRQCISHATAAAVAASTNALRRQCISHATAAAVAASTNASTIFVLAKHSLLNSSGHVAQHRAHSEDDCPAIPLARRPRGAHLHFFLDALSMAALTVFIAAVLDFPHLKNVSTLFSPGMSTR